MTVGGVEAGELEAETGEFRASGFTSNVFVSD